MTQSIQTKLKKLSPKKGDIIFVQTPTDMTEAEIISIKQAIHQAQCDTGVRVPALIMTDPVEVMLLNLNEKKLLFNYLLDILDKSVKYD